jgi:hypothetical protein
VEQRLADQPLTATYRNAEIDLGAGDPAEYVLPVRWTETRSRDEHVWEKGMFANQNSACKLRNRFTLDRLTSAFKLGDD